EFSYRINRSIFKKTIFHKTIERLMNHSLIFQQNISYT
ncbi:IS1595 family transposase, partial [Fulvivirgaceae bacterium BMA10]|nr:IS1595 family transposase [Fulvivirgaceae bacterium BMA10]MDN5202092.1 IS1595 family transposase [Fulvivirgaceae bacterium BMA10]MDN5202552.1 IS1595 family transposase [Fulvivirgaceae bacterium BMA10]MDN5204113.1 IS1595 family transposase [Fulvivirgaceae bacterium BMA10]MDN5205614.1 IS1595 family transposase [Fulvivirgaceae bacterium BMA10]